MGISDAGLNVCSGVSRSWICCFCNLGNWKCLELNATSFEFLVRWGVAVWRFTDVAANDSLTFTLGIEYGLLNAPLFGEVMVDDPNRESKVDSRRASFFFWLWRLEHMNSSPKADNRKVDAPNAIPIMAPTLNLLFSIDRFILLGAPGYVILTGVVENKSPSTPIGRFEVGLCRQAACKAIKTEKMLVIVQIAVI